MKDGSLIENVILAWGREIVKIVGRKGTNGKELGLNLKDIVDAVN
jgi:hypothetical protein